MRRIAGSRDGRRAFVAHWDSLTPLRDGEVNPERREVTDLDAMSAEIKQLAEQLGAADTGMTALKPEFIELGVDLPHKNVIAIICYEDYAAALRGPDEVDLEAMGAYAKCADISAEIARYIREELGYRRWRITTVRSRYRRFRSFMKSDSENWDGTAA